MVGCVLDQGWSVAATAERFQVDPKTVRKWRDRFLVDGEAGLLDRSSRPHQMPNKTRPSVEQRVLDLRRRRRWGAAHIGAHVGIAASTVQRICRSAGLGRLDRGDRCAQPRTIQRYQRERPGELVHVDIKKLAGIPDGGGWRIHGRGNDGHGGYSGVGYRFLHSAVDDRTRLAYSEIHDDEQAITAAGFWFRAYAWFADHGITVERVLTDNGSCYRSRIWRREIQRTDCIHKRTRPYRPQTNGKIERFHRILLEEWAYIRDWTSEQQRRVAYGRFLHFYNHHRSHGALGWHTPMHTLSQCLGDNVPAQHN
ncbi:MAG TPA: IS481 family transposase [Vitreimonas sp.]|nr:IS481 family transposase [Vitreimonas sp.]